MAKGSNVLKSLPHSYFTLNTNAVLQFIRHIFKLVSHKFVVGFQALLRGAEKVKLLKNLKRVALSAITSVEMDLQQFLNANFKVKASYRMQM